MSSRSGGRPERTPLFETVKLTKRFGAFVADDAIDLRVYPGEIHALLGENGAGKSTLVKLITGLLQPDDGEMRWNGEAVWFANPAAAQQHGIAYVSQQFALFENLTVAENVALGLRGREPLKALAKRLALIAEQYGLPLDPVREVWRLSAGERQRIEIVRALLQRPKFLILDEPTAVLTPTEADRLFVVLKRLQAEGCALLYISHRLDEVRRTADVATILRRGRVVAHCDPRAETAASLARMMIGADVMPPKQQPGDRIGAARLSVKALRSTPADPHAPTLNDVALDVRAGEIVGIAGVAGNGQDELFAALSGERPVEHADSILIDDAPVGDLSINARRRRGAAFVPEQRLGHATVPGMPLSDNALLTGHVTQRLSRFGVVDSTAAIADIDQITAIFDIRKPSRDPQAMRLSGGNLQKFIIGREILRRPSLLIVNQPSWGLDAGAANAIRQALIELAVQGAAVLIISQDLDELIEICDRIAVMLRGRLSPLHSGTDFDREQLGLLMSGSGWPAPEAQNAADA